MRQAFCFTSSRHSEVPELTQGRDHAVKLKAVLVQTALAFGAAILIAAALSGQVTSELYFVPPQSPNPFTCIHLYHSSLRTPGANVLNLQFNSDGSARNLNGYSQITTITQLAD